MLFPDFRARRLRASDNFRRMIRETKLSCDDFILPLFAIEGKGVKKPIESMPGHFQLSCDHIVKKAKPGTVILFNLSGHGLLDIDAYQLILKPHS